MRLEDCILTVNLAVTAPLARTEPEEAWVRARDSDAIPAPVFDLYRRVNYLSFGSAPSFLKDDENVLFSYFSMLLRGLMESLVDADDQVRSFIEVQKLAYDIGKKIRGEPWDPAADARARRHFRDLLIALESCLDALADLAALFLTGLIPRLRFGRAQFSRIEAWLERPLPPFGLALTPYDQPLRQLYDALCPLVRPGGPERDWLPLMRLLRNKAVHLGQPVFRQVGLHDKTGRFYTFIPRQWPYIWERHVKQHDPNLPKDPDLLPKLFREALVHQDVVTYAQGLRAKVRDVVGTGVAVLTETYEEVKNFGSNQAALAELHSNSEAYDFEYFLDTQDGAADAHAAS